jgi:antitoxin (DNA-binding transcriptional repressor) of toxin-antitoxin stability system
VTLRLIDDVIERDGRPVARLVPRLAQSLHDRVAEALERSVE